MVIVIKNNGKGNKESKIREIEEVLKDYGIVTQTQINSKRALRNG